MEGLKGEKLKLVICGGLSHARSPRSYLVYLARNFGLLPEGLKRANERFRVRE